MNIVELITFLGWVTIINIAILMFTTLMIVLFKGCISSIHAKIFSMNKEDVFKAYFQYLAHYKILILFFNLAPYIVLKFIL